MSGTRNVRGCGPKGRAILKEVMDRRGVGPKDFFGAGRMKHIVLARRTAIKVLKAEGFSSAAIARLMKRNVSTVDYWIKPEYRARSMAYCLNYMRVRAAAEARA